MDFKTPRKPLLLAVLGLCSSFAFSCNSPQGLSGGAPAGSGEGSNVVSTVTLDTQDYQNLSAHAADSITSDVINAAVGSVFAPGTAVGTFGFPLTGVLIQARSSCVSISGEGSTLHETLNCPNITGSLDLTNTTVPGESVDNLTVKISLTSDSGANAALNDSFEFTSAIMTGIVSIDETMDDIFNVGISRNYESQGTATDVMTPNDPFTPFAGGTIQVNRSLNLTKNGLAAGTFNVMSDGLEYSSCGLSGGSITLSGPTQSCELTFTSTCGRPMVACNRQLSSL